MVKLTKIKSGESVGIKLTPKERQMLLDSLIFTSRELEAKIRLAIVGQHQVQLTLDDLGELAGCVAAEAMGAFTALRSFPQPCRCLTANLPA